MSRRWLVSISIVAHVAVGLGLFASGVWRLERLESDHRLAGIGVMTQSQTSGGGPTDLPAPVLKKKPQNARKIVKEPHQPQKPDDTKVAAIGTTASVGDGLPGEGPPGDGRIGPPGGEPCVLPPCDSAPALPKQPEIPRVVVKPRMVPPNVLTALRTSGETQIHPSRNVQNQMLGDHVTRATATLKVCIAASGAISSVSVLATTKYAAYDQQLVEAARSWRYRPYMVDGVPAPACSAVSFIYSIQQR